MPLQLTNILVTYLTKERNKSYNAYEFSNLTYFHADDSWVYTMNPFVQENQSLGFRNTGQTQTGNICMCLP